MPVFDTSINATLSASWSARCSKSLGYTSSFIAIHLCRVGEVLLNHNPDVVGLEQSLSQSSPHVEEASSPFGATYRRAIVLPELASHQSTRTKRS